VSQSAHSIRALLIEDNPGDARLIREMLREAGDTLAVVELAHVDRLARGLERLSQGDRDVVLLDLSLPDSQGFDTFTTVRAHAPDVAIVVLSGLNDENLAVRAVQEGAQDYLVKGQVDGRGGHGSTFRIALPHQ
jgi:CheY-like chemotaxis protein